MERCCILSSAHAHPSYIYIGRKEFLNKTYLDIIEIKDKKEGLVWLELFWFGLEVWIDSSDK